MRNSSTIKARFKVGYLLITGTSNLLILSFRLMSLTGEFINNDKSTESDEWALKNGFVSVVPVKFDLTNYEVIDKIKSWNL